VIQRVKREDCAILDALVRGEADTFFAAVQKNKDRNNLCGLSPIFMALYVVQPSPGTVLHYDMSVEDENESLVSFASLRY
jgi:predicted class III extradiol MEMO1 family dioxygenase